MTAVERFTGESQCLAMLTNPCRSQVDSATQLVVAALSSPLFLSLSSSPICSLLFLALSLSLSFSSLSPPPLSFPIPLFPYPSLSPLQQTSPSSLPFPFSFSVCLCSSERSPSISLLQSSSFHSLLKKLQLATEGSVSPQEMQSWPKL